ncbi:MAG: M50 family peptidase [Pseudonocardiaceae bacterium]|nr:M50 family peptidase [Pseudonocardiaceae bacterium]
MERASDLWERIVEGQPQPPLAVALVTCGVALLIVLSGGPWRLARGVVTIVHEAGHALIAVLVGRRLSGIRLHSDTSGVTVSKGKTTGPGMVATAFAGYPAPSLLGLGFAGLLGGGRIAALLTVCAVLLLAVLIMVRNAYGVLSVLATGAVLVGVAWLASAPVQAAFAYLITWLLLFAGLRPVIELQQKRRRGRAPHSDADQLAGLTGIPGVLWVLIFGVAALTCVVLGGATLLAEVLSELPG